MNRNGYAGIDIGFGDVKIFYTDGNESIQLKFPTAVKIADEFGNVNFDGDFGSYDTYEYQGEKYIVGNDAVREGQYTRSKSFLMKYSAILLSHALKVANINPAAIGIGLPLGFYSAEKEILQKTIKDAVVNGQRLDFFNLSVFPQGVACVTDYFHNFTDASQAAPTLMVMDVGYNTIDIVVIDKGKLDTQKTEMLEKQGVSIIVEQVRKLLKEKFNLEPSIQTAKEVFISKSIKIFSEQISLKDECDLIVTRYLDNLMNRITDNWGSFLYDADAIILAGGGAHYIDANYKPNFVKLKDPEFSNARGYCRGVYVEKPVKEEVA